MPVNPSISYNARFTKPKEVTKNFVANPQFESLCQAGNSVVFGPRGSGKTTLFKMLHPQALAAIEAEADVPDYFAGINFRGLYVDTDINWEEQWRFRVPREFKSVKEALQEYAFVTHTLESAVGCLQDYMSIPKAGPFARLRLKPNPTKESEFAKQFADTFGLDELKDHSLSGVRSNLDKRTNEIAGIVKRAQKKPETIVECDNPKYYIDIPKTLDTLIKILTRYYPSTNELFWAFLFDEMEIAPEPLVRALKPMLRGFNQNCYVKISLAPYKTSFAGLERGLVSADNATNLAKDGHDYERIDLVYRNKDHIDDFTEKLMAHYLSSNGLNIDEATSYFGTSYLPSRKTRRGYGKGGENFDRVQELLKNDSAFQEWCQRHGLLDDDGLLKTVLDEDHKAATLRKGIQIIALRNMYLRKNQGKSSVIRYKAYTGWPTIGQVPEANPRWIFDVLRPMVKQLKVDNKLLNNSIQAEALSGSIDRFVASLKSTPLDVVDRTIRRTSLYSVVDRIGVYFNNKLYEDGFTPELNLAFEVDAKCGEVERTAVARAANIGAVVAVDTKQDNPLAGDVEGHVFRLNFMLCAFYKLPLLIERTKSVKLSSILLHSPSKNVNEKQGSLLE